MQPILVGYWVGLGWVGLGWVGLGWVGLGWVGLDWVGLGWVGLGWVGAHSLIITFGYNIYMPGDTYLRRAMAERGTSANGLPRPKRVPPSDEYCRSLGRRRRGEGCQKK